MDYEYSNYVTTPITQLYPMHTDELSVPIATFVVIGILAATENAIALIIVISSKKFRKKRNIFLFSLSLADFVVGVLSFLILFEVFYNSHMFGAALDAMFLVSMFSISAVCIERYIAIVAAPFTYKNVVTFKRCIIACLLFWILTGSIVLIVYAVVYDKWVRLAFCLLSLIANVANYVLYFRISRALTNNDRNVTKNLGKNVIGRSQKLIRSFIILLVIASICWFPLCCFYIIAVFDESVDGNLFVLNILYCISLSNSFINPFIYWYRLPGMKEGFYDLVCCFRNAREEGEDGQTHNPTLPTASTSAV